MKSKVIDAILLCRPFNESNLTDTILIKVWNYTGRPGGVTQMVNEFSTGVSNLVSGFFAQAPHDQTSQATIAADKNLSQKLGTAIIPIKVSNKNSFTPRAIFF